MYDKILVAVDHSKLSDRAVHAARDLAVLSQGEVWILHLREREVGFKTGATIMDGAKDDAAAAAAAAVSAAVEVLTQAGVKAHGEVRNTLFGYAAGEIVDDAKERDVDIIVMGSRGRRAHLGPNGAGEANIGRGAL